MRKQFLNILLIIAIILTLALKLYYLDRLSTAGRELKEVEIQVGELNLENESLNVELNRLTSLKILKEEAILKGYTDPVIITP